MKSNNKKPIRRDGFRGQKDYFSGGYPFVFRPTEKDAQKRLVQKQPIPKKK